MLYAPLQFRAQAEHPGWEFEARIEQFKDFGAFLDEESIPDKDEYIRLFLSEDFASPQKGGGIGKILTLNLPYLLAQLGLSYKDVKNGKIDWVTELKDLYLAPVLFDIWGKNKQVYKPDPDFADALMNMKGLKMSFSSLHHLPYNAFYIDLGQCYGLSEIDGIFVFLNPDGERIYVTQYILMDGMFFSYYNSFIKQNGSDLIEIKSESLPQSHYLYVPECMKGGEKIREKDIEVDRRKITMMCLQFVIYLSSQEPDILESPITKGTYKPSGERDKNKFSEIRMWETGYRFGASFRKKAEEYKKASETTEDKTGKKRKSPIPHFKCAHFQHYWVGKGRNTCIIRWKEAYPASLKDGAEIKEAVIHMG